MFGLHPVDKDLVLGRVIKSKVRKHPTSILRI